MSERLTADRATVWFAGQPKPVLEELTLTIPAGSFLAVVGPSGCGKSTLLNCFAGLVRPNSGQVLDHGAPILGAHPSRGIVFQRDILFPWMTAEQNLIFALRAAKAPKRTWRARVRELLEAVHLDSSAAGRRPYELSGGMRQRVGIARMLAGEPEVMLMDEPFGALDAQTRLRMQDLTTEIWESRGVTVVFVTHDVDEALRLASTIVVLGHDGAIRAHLDNPLPRPRPAGGLADLPHYAELRRSVHYHLEVPDASVAPV